MNGYMKVTAIILVVIAVLMVFFYISAKVQKETHRMMIQSSWGKIPGREYEYEEFEAISHYFRHKMTVDKDMPYIDDITWNDVDMDSVFCMLNQTYSSAGQEYLYYMLRTPTVDQDVLDQREKLIRCYMEQKKTRLDMQMIFHDIGRSRKVSIIDYISRLDDVKKESNARHFLLLAAYAGSLAVMMFNTGIGIMVLLFSIMYGISTYFKRKGQIEPYIVSFVYILKLLKAADTVSKVKTPEFETYTENIRKAKSAFFKFKTGAVFLTSNAAAGGDLVDGILDYVRILFHVDLIKFNMMSDELKKHQKEVEEILDNIGLLEATAAIASFRAYLPFYAEPKLKKQKKVFMNLKNVYHPMITEPVANSIEENRGVLITGSNASGKSTFLKTVSINAILAQSINTCPASEYEACFFQIYSSMALADNLQGKESYYIVEIKSLKRILNHKNDEIPVLCFVDEVLRGTNTVERIAASAQILKSLAREQVLCFAATHDIELTYVLEENYSNYHFQEEIEENDILFNYQLQKGRATSRNAIRLLGIIGYEQEIIEKADQTAARFMQTGEWSLS